MDAKLDCEVDVEGAVDMVDRGEEGISIVGAPACALIQPTHSPRASRQRPIILNVWACGHSMLPVLREVLPINFLFVFLQQFNDLNLSSAATYQDYEGPIFFSRVPTVTAIHSGFIFVHQSW